MNRHLSSCQKAQLNSQVVLVILDQKVNPGGTLHMIRHMFSAHDRGHDRAHVHFVGTTPACTRWTQLPTADPFDVLD